AFNLSQDQTLQFDLDKFILFRVTHLNGIEVNFTSIFMSVCFGPEKNLAIRHQTPTLIGCILLRNRVQNNCLCT
ncbi:MAG TPA: hypothetical protein PLF19_15890, partial [Ottowia sp.]|nr:hypothetical protein [Ottowia sp.]